MLVEDDGDLGSLVENDTFTKQVLNDVDDNTGVKMNIVTRSGCNKLITFKDIASLPILKSTEPGNRRKPLSAILPSWNITSAESMKVIKVKDDAKKKKLLLKKKSCYDKKNVFCSNFNFCVARQQQL